jgi:protein TonB
MEIKKSKKADLEGSRTQRLILGLVVSLAMLYVALEYNIAPEDPLDDPELIEILSSDEELAPLIRPENELALAPKAEPEPTVKLKVVEETESQIEEELKPQQEQPLEGDVTDELPQEEEPASNKDDDVVSFRVVEDLPQFPGGYLEFMKWLTRNLKYPTAAEERKLQGKVIAEFIVNKDGSVTDVNIVKSLNSDCDHEALRVLRMMPRWMPGIQDDKPCRTKVRIPIVFKL